MESANKKMKTITILLTKYSDLFGRFLCGIKGKGYSHASISIDDTDEVFYSFNLKGFVIEKPKVKKPRKRLPGSVCIRVQVPEDVHEMIENYINKFVVNKEKYAYSKLGVALCLFHIPYKTENKYFCSQFVAEVLSKAGAIKSKKKETLFLPNHFINDIELLFANKYLVYNAV